MLNDVMFIVAISLSCSLVLTTEIRAEGTPDFQTPASETVCDGYEGQAFGLCNAYCEAMDCELANDGDPSTSPNASAQACSNVAANFEAATGGALLPCEVAPCPCFAYDGFNAAIDASGPDAFYCDDTDTEIVSEGGANPNEWGVGVWDYGDAGECGWYSKADGYPTAQFAHITHEEAQQCIDAVRPLLYDSGACGV